MFEVPASKKSIKQNRFEFTLEGKKFDIPLLEFAPVKAAELMEQSKMVAALLVCCESEAARDAIRSLDGDQFGALADAWDKASGATVGKSRASSNS